jgi:hypothetical protein
VNSTDFTTVFYPDFLVGNDGGSGTDMDGNGAVNANDFNASFMPQLDRGRPGPSGRACAGTPDCP